MPVIADAAPVSVRMWILIGLLVLSAGLLREARLGPSGTLRVIFMDVGQGDSALVVTPSGRQILIDGGPDGSAVREIKTFMPLLDRSLDMIVMSHGDKDHLAALPAIFENYDVGVFVDTGIPGTSDAYVDTQRLVLEHAVPVIVPDPAADIDLGDGVTLDIVWPPLSLTKETVGDTVNNASIVLRILYRDHAILFTGDIEESAERAILASGADLRSDVIKVPHHGSKTSSSTGFLLAVSPEKAVISVSKRNTYGHPNPGVLARYAALGISVSTTMSGSITMTFD